MEKEKINYYMLKKDCVVTLLGFPVSITSDVIVKTVSDLSHVHKLDSKVKEIVNDKIKFDK